MTAPRTNLKALDRAGLEAFAVAQGMPRYRGAQLAEWLYKRGAADFDAITVLSKTDRQLLAERAHIGQIVEVQRQQATDGTLKLLFRLESGRHIESVLIPDFEDETDDVNRLTVCVSSQVGCAMGCHFCATGLMGFQENLTCGEIFDQVRHLDQIARATFDHPVTNVVFMGMGEPLQNYDAVLSAARLLSGPEGLGLGNKRITISTVGLAKRIRQLADDRAPYRLALSLHAPTDAQRSAIMPVNRSEKTDLTALREALQYYHRTTGLGVTYEYCMFAGVNDAEADARHLGRVAQWIPSKVNLIMYNPVEGTGFRATDEATLNRFIRVLVQAGVRVTVRRSRGQDIDAACGQLAVQAT